MGKFKLTDDQKQVLESKDKNLLVSASAGSGKTATLIEKIYSLVVDENIDIKNILVITFTEAASSEMKVRLKNKFFESGANLRARNQLEELNSSYISTLHSFCSKMLKKYFYILDLNPNFIVLNEENAKYLKVKALEETFNYYNKNNDENFVKLSAIFGGRNFLSFKDAIVKYYEFLCSISNKQEFVKNTYKRCYEEDLNKNIACKILNEYMLNSLFYYKKQLEEYLIKAEQLKANYFVSFILDIIKKIEQVKYEKTFLQNKKTFSELNFDKIQTKDLTQNEKIFAEEFKGFYDEFTKNKTTISENILCKDDENLTIQKLKNAKEYLEIFNAITNVFEDNYNKLKLKKNALDFNDLERFLLRLLQEQNVKEEINKNFKYVFVDEYQDINEVQENILLLISKQANMVMVGDVKQSIYGFRNSTPNIFINKSLKYSSNDSNGKLILLNDNFRSDARILNFVNSIFSKIMSVDFGGVDYKGKSMLKGLAKFEESKDLPAIKMCLIDKTNDEEIEENFSGIYSVLDDKNNYSGQLNSTRKEAMVIAENIGNLIGKQYYNSKEEKFKTISFKDIAILARSNSFLSEVCSVLSEYKIPISTNKKENIFLDEDVYMLLSLLRLLSSTHDDISLSIVLTSIFGGLSYNNLAQIKKEFIEEKFFYESVNKYMLEGQNEEIKQKLTEFFNLINDLRQKVYASFSIYDIFIWLDRKFNFLTELSALPNGEERRQTVQSYIDSFKGADYNYDLEKYLNYVENFEKDDKFVSALNGSDDSVKVGTIHSSKGLEYPVVILCGLDKYFSRQVYMDAILHDASLGLGVSSYELESFVKQPNLAKNAFVTYLKQKEKEEETRLLYVALTRAKNNLILVSSINSKTVKRVENYVEASSCNSYLPWVLSGLSEIGFNAIKSGKKVFVDKNSGFDVCVEMRTDDDFVVNRELNKDIGFLFNNKEESKTIKTMLDYKMETASNIALKNTVSSMLQEYAKEEKTSFNLQPKKLTIFENVIDKTMLGTIYHKIMQEIDFNNKDCTNVEYLQAIINKLNIGQNYLQEINLNAIKTCVENVKNLNPKLILKEQPFLSYVKYCDIFKDSNITDKILIQGVVDLLIKTPKGTYIIDYKTNNVRTADQLVEKYKLQLSLYKQCVEKAMHISIDNTLIYSFCLNTFIKII